METFFYPVARSYLHAAQLLAREKKHDDSGYLAAPIYMLIGFTVELMLKAYLSAKGVDDAKLKGAGHDLKSAYQLALDHGLETAQPIEEIVVKMHDAHKAHAFRYMKNEERVLPLIDPVLAVLDKWDDELRVEFGIDQQPDDAA